MPNAGRVTRWLVWTAVVLVAGAAAAADRVVLKKGCDIDGRAVLEGHIYARTAKRLFLRTADGRRLTVDRAHVRQVIEDEASTSARAQPKTSRAAPSLLLPEIPHSPEAEKAILAKVGEHAKIRRSAHYSVLYTGDRSEPGKAIQILERVYRRFLSYFQDKGFAVQAPKHKPVAIVFSTRAEFSKFAGVTGPAAKHVQGLYNGEDGSLCLFVNAGGEEHRELLAKCDRYEHLLARMKKWLKTLAPRQRVVVSDEDGCEELLSRRELRSRIKKEQKRLDVLQRRINTEMRNADISVASHEATHQLVFSTGLLDGRADPPIWINEGLATFFESSRGARWRGVGQVNIERIDDYRRAQRDGRLVRLTDLLKCRSFLGQQPEVMSSLYAHAWGLTYYLMKKRESQLVEYLRILGRRPAGRAATDKERVADFKRAFGEDLAAIDDQWRAFMDGLRPD